MTPRSPLYQWHRLEHARKRRRWRRRIDHIYTQLVGSWDADAFRERFRPYWDPFAGTGPAKFLDIEIWVREAIFRYLLVVGDGATPRKILDIGAGTGYFLSVCRHQGHDVRGLDLAGEPLYDACFDFFDLPRTVHCVEPHQRLPDPDERLDLVTAFMTCFNRYSDERSWGADPWRALLRDIRNRMQPGGQFVIKFNLEATGNRYYSPEVRQALRNASGFRTRFFLDYAMLRAC